MKPQITPNAFKDKGEAIRKIAELDLWPVTIFKNKDEEVREQPHFHEISAWFFVIEGGLSIQVGEGLEGYSLNAGDIAFIPSGCWHAVEVPQHVVVINAFDTPNWKAGVEQKFLPEASGTPRNAAQETETSSGHSIVEM